MFSVSRETSVAVLAYKTGSEVIMPRYVQILVWKMYK